MDLVEDRPPQTAAARGRRWSGQEQRLRGRDQDVRGMALHLAPLLGRVSPVRMPTVRSGTSRPRRSACRWMPASRARGAFDVHAPGAFRGDQVEDATAISRGRRRLHRKPVQAPEKGGQGLAASGGSGHQRVRAPRHRLPPRSCTSVGAANAASNHRAGARVNRSSARDMAVSVRPSTPASRLFTASGRALGPSWRRPHERGIETRKSRSWASSGGPARSVRWWSPTETTKTSRPAACALAAGPVSGAESGPSGRP